MEATSSKINNMFNLDMIKLDRFDGINFTRLKDKILFLLTKLDITYTLSPYLQLIPPPFDEDFEGIKVERKKCKEDKVYCRGFVLNSFSNKLYDLYHLIQSLQEI